MLIFLLSACSIGTKYQRPQFLIPAQFGAVEYADTSSIADLAWNDFFSDPVLKGLIDRGIKYNHDLLAAVKRMDIAERQLQQSRFLQHPEIGINITGQVNRPSNNSLNGLSAKSFLGKTHIENYSATALVSWEADIWGKIRKQKEISLQQYLRTKEAAKAVQTKLVADIAHGYFNLLMLDRQLQIAKRNLSLSDSFLTATQLLKEAGLANALAVQQAASQKQSTELLLPAISEDISLQENALQLLTGQLPGTLPRHSSINEIALQDKWSVGLPAAMVSRRPDVKSQEISLVMATLKIGIAQANMYPAINLTAGGGLESFKSSNWFNIPNSLFGLAAGTIAQPIFKRKELKTAFEVAKLERDEAVIRFRQSVLQASTEVVNAIIQSERLKEQQQIAMVQTDTLKKAVGNAQLLFKSDLANYLEVITAQSNALEAELYLAQIQRSRLDAMVELYRSLGGGWNN